MTNDEMLKATSGRDTDDLRCDITKNPCGTDTWLAGSPCLCSPCVQYLINNQEPLGPEFQKVIDDNYWDLLESD